MNGHAKYTSDDRMDLDDDDVVFVDMKSAASSKKGSTSAVISESNKADGRGAKDQGNEAFKNKRYNEAVRLYSHAISSDPSESSYYTNRAAANMSMGNYKSALEDCNRANTMQSSSPNVKTLVRLARCHFQLGDLDSAKATLERALSVAPGDSAAQTLLQAVERTRQHIESFYRFRREKSYNMANIALDQASAEVTSLPLSWRLMRGDLLLKRGQIDNANGTASDALRLFPNDPEAHILRARVLIEMGTDLSRAVQHGQAALRADPENRAAASLIRRCRKMERSKEEANAAFKLGQTEDAINLYSQALQQAGDVDESEDSKEGKANGFRAVLFCNRATANAKLARHEEAIRDCNESLGLSAGYAKALRVRARAHLAVEKYEEAVSDFKKAIEETPMGETEGLKRELRSAEIDLKRSKKKDYYKILGVEKTATDVELKKAYRKESLKHHPDKGGDEEKFKLCNEAFGVLSDAQKRRRYDLGADDDELNGMSGGGFGGGGMEVNLADLFNMSGGGMGGGMGGMHSSFGGAGGPFGSHSHQHGHPHGGNRRGRPPPGFSFG